MIKLQSVALSHIADLRLVRASSISFDARRQVKVAKSAPQSSMEKAEVDELRQLAARVRERDGVCGSPTRR